MERKGHFKKLYLYDAERYHAGRRPQIVREININNMTEKEINAKVAEIRSAQHKKNDAFREMCKKNPHASTGPRENINGTTLYASADLHNNIGNTSYASAHLRNNNGNTSYASPHLHNNNGNTSYARAHLRNNIEGEKGGPQNLLLATNGVPAVNIKKKKLTIKWDHNTGNTFVLFGASKSGKTTLMMKLYNKHFPTYKPLKMMLTTLFAMNPQIPLYGTGVGAKYLIKCPYLNDNSSAYIDWQRRLNKMNDNKYTFLNMFDDFIGVRHESIVNNLILTYRNSNMSAIICLQYVNLLSKAARSNINNIFLMHMNTDESIDVVIKAYLGSIIKRGRIDNPIQWYRDITADHNYIYINPLHSFIYISKTGEELDM